MLAETVAHLLNHVLPAVADYETAEDDLSAIYDADKTPAAWEPAARTARRRAFELAVAVDGLTDRFARETGESKTTIRAAVSALCNWPGTTTERLGAHDRVRGVATVYKHKIASDPTLSVDSDDDVLVVGLGYGLDGYGVGKFGGVEVLVRERSGEMHKFLGDVPVAIYAWFQLLRLRGAELPSQTYSVCGKQVHP